MSPTGKPSRKPARAKAKAPRAATVARRKSPPQVDRNVPKRRAAASARKSPTVAKRAPASSRQKAAPAAAKPARRPAVKPKQTAGAQAQSGATAKRKLAAKQAAFPAPPVAPTPVAGVPPPRRGFPPRPSSRPGIRLAGSSPSRLTIKPGAVQGPRPQLEISTKPRPSGPRPLSEVELDEDEVLIDVFEAVLEGDPVRVTAVLERTCVYVDRTGDRRLARKTDLIVEADKLPIRRRGLY